MKATATLNVTLALFLGIVAPDGSRAQSPQPAEVPPAVPVVIAGRVVTGAGGTPIRGARVTLTPDRPEVPIVTTDTAGTFRLTVPRTSIDRFTLEITKAGFVRGDEPPAVSDRPVEIRLQRAATIAGRVSDEHGDPVVRVLVAALKQPEIGKDRVATALGTTDERGEYRLDGLPEAVYAVCVRTFTAVVTGQGNQLPYARTSCHRSTTPLGTAQPVVLHPGDERRNIDVVVGENELTGMPVALFDDRFRRYRRERGPVDAEAGSVHGRVVTIDGTPVSSASVYLFGRDRYDSQMATTNESGEFRFADVTPGPLLISAVKNGYVQIEAGRALETFTRNRASSTLTVGDTRGRALVLAANEQKEVELRIARSGTLSGTVTDEYGDPVQGISVQAFRVQDDAGQRRRVLMGSLLTNDQGKFRLFNLLPGEYAIAAGLGPTRDVSMDLAQDVVGVNISLPGAR